MTDSDKTKGEIAAAMMSVSLKEYVESRFTGINSEINNSRKDLERRLLDLNRLRQQVLDDRGQFVSRELHDRLQSDVSDIASEIKSIKTQIATWGAALGVFFTVVQIGLSVVFWELFHK